MNFPKSIPEGALTKARNARSAAFQLKRRVQTHTLTQDEGERLLERIVQGLDAVLGDDLNAERNAFALFGIDGGRR